MTPARKAPIDREVLIGALILAGIAALVILGNAGALSKLFTSESSREVRAVFPSTAQLRVGDRVRIDGLDSGVVERVALNDDKRSATVTMSVHEKAGSLYRDATAILRFKTVLGGSLYVDLERGSPTQPPLGDSTIPLGHTAGQVELDDITAAFKNGAQEGLQILPGELADGLRDNQAPGRVLDTVADVAPGVERGLNATRGTLLDDDLQGLIKHTAATLEALDTPAGDIETIVSGSAATLRTTAGRADDIRQLLRLGPGTEREINATLDRLRVTLDLADSLVDKLQGPATQLAPTFAALRPVLVNAGVLLRNAVPLLHALRPAAVSLAGTARRGLPMLNELTPSIDRTRDTILPMLSEVDPATQKSTAVMIGGTFAGLGGGAGGQMDQNGHFIRFPATLGSSPINSLPCQIYLNNPDSAQLLACNDLQTALQTYMNYNPFGPTPGTTP